MITYVYVAGPITKGVPIQNVVDGLDAANELRDLGFVPFVPQLSYYWHNLHHAREYEDWLAYDFQWILKCDALLRLPGYSPGAEREIEFCRENGIPVFYSIEDLAHARKLPASMLRPVTFDFD